MTLATELTAVAPLLPHAAWSGTMSMIAAAAAVSPQPLVSESHLAHVTVTLPIAPVSGLSGHLLR